MFRTALRTVTRPAFNALRTQSTPLRLSVARTFSNTPLRKDATSLSTKLAQEIKYEEENASEAEPEFIRDFKSEGVWQVHDQPGADEIQLTRTYGNEDIRIIFSISDLDAESSQQQEPVYLEDMEESSSQRSGSNAPASSNDQDVEEADEEGSSSTTSASFPVDVSITVTKNDGSAKGALAIDAVAQDGMFGISNVAYYPNAKVATGLTSENDWSRQALYMGPAFENLDEGVQVEFEAYLEERAIDSALALFIPDLAEWKEQQEYLAWLKSVKSFVEA